METSVYQRFKKIRREADETQSEMAFKLGISTQQVSNIERGRSGVSTDITRKIQEVYKVSSSWLLFGEEESEKGMSEDEGRSWKAEAYRKLEEENERLWDLVKTLVGKGASQALAKMLGNRSDRDVVLTKEGVLKAA